MTQQTIKTAMVLAAGHGTRMRPLTNDRSKAMVEVAGKPLIDHMLDRLAHAGVETAVVNVHAHANHLEDHLRQRQTGPNIIISDERDALLETGGGVVKALPLLGDDPIFVCNIDAIWAGGADELTSLSDQWRPEMDGLLLLTPTRDAFGFAGVGDFETDISGRIIRRKETFAKYVYAGIQLCRPKTLKGFAVEKFSFNKIWNKHLNGNKLFGHVMTSHWLHIGDPQAQEMAETILKPNG